MTTSTPAYAKTTPLTQDKVRVLNELSRTAGDLRYHLSEIIKRAQEQMDRAKQGFHMSGFEGDLLGQSRYQADAAAVKRSAMMTAAWAAGCQHEAIVKALVPTRQKYATNGAHTFHEGDTFDWDPALHEERTR